MRGEEKVKQDGGDNKRRREETLGKERRTGPVKNRGKKQNNRWWVEKRLKL